MSKPWYEEIDLTKQTATFHLNGGRIRGPSGNTVSSLTMGKGTPWVDRTVEFDATTRSFLVRHKGKLEKVLIDVYAVEVN